MLLKKPTIIPIVRKGNRVLPSYQTDGAVGLDLRANLEKEITLSPGQRVLIPVGFEMELPTGVEAQVRPRSGLALKQGITVLNAPGTIDGDYRSEVGVILIHHGEKNYTIAPGDRIAQLVFAPYIRVQWEERKSLAATVRGTGGYGSTGVK